MALHDDHGAWLGPGEAIRDTPWQPCLRAFRDGSQQQRFLREVIDGQPRAIRYFQLTTDPTTLPKATTCLVMTNLPGELQDTLGLELN